MRSLGWALVQSDWCPYKKGRFGHSPSQGARRVKTVAEMVGGCIHKPRNPKACSKPQMLERGIGQNFLTASVGASPAHTSNKAVQPPGLGGGKRLLVKLPRLWCLWRHPQLTHMLTRLLGVECIIGIIPNLKGLEQSNVFLVQKCWRHCTISRAEGYTLCCLLQLWRNFCSAQSW